MSQKTVHKIPKEILCQSVDTMKVGIEVLEWLHKNNYVTIEDIVDKQFEIPENYRGSIYVYLMYGVSC